MVVVPSSDDFTSCWKLWTKVAYKMAAGGEKKTNGKETIRAKKDAFKALLQNRSSSDLQSRYSEAQKAAAQAVKIPKERSWEEVWSSVGF